MLSKERLQEIRELVEKASEGPWKVYSRPIEGTDKFQEHRIGTEWDHPQLKAPAPIVTTAVHRSGDVHASIEEHDARFIAASREVIPELLAEVERLRTKLDSLPRLSFDEIVAARSEGQGE